MDLANNKTFCLLLGVLLCTCGGNVLYAANSSTNPGQSQPQNSNVHPEVSVQLVNNVALAPPFSSPAPTPTTSSNPRKAQSKPRVTLPSPLSTPPPTLMSSSVRSANTPSTMMQAAQAPSQSTADAQTISSSNGESFKTNTVHRSINKSGIQHGPDSVSGGTHYKKKRKPLALAFKPKEAQQPGYYDKQYYDDYTPPPATPPKPDFDSKYTYLDPGEAAQVISDSKAREMTLNDVITLALRNDPNIKNAEIQRVIDKFSLKAAYYGFQPQISFGGTVASYSKLEGDPSTSTYALNPSVSLATPYSTSLTATSSNSVDQYGIWTPTASLEMDQPLLRGFGPEVTQIPLENAKDTEEQAKLTLKSTIIQEVQNAISSYYGLVSDRYNIETNLRSLKTDEATLAQTIAKIKTGQTAPTDRVRAEANIASDKNNLQQAVIQYQNDKQNLLVTLWLPTDTAFTVPKDVNIKPVALEPLDEAVQTALKYNTGYQTSVIGLRSSYRSVLSAEDALRWKLDLKATTSLGNARADGETNTGIGNFVKGAVQNNVSLDLDIPIRDITAQSTLVQAKVGLEQAKNTLDVAKRALITKLITDRQTLDSDVKQLSLSATQLKLKQETYDIDAKQFTFGMVDNFQLQNDQDDVTSARQTLITDKISYINDLATYHVDLGNLLEQEHVLITY